MARPGNAEGSAIIGAQRRLVELALDALRGELPAMRGFTDVQLSRTRRDFGYIVSFAAAAVLLSDASIFEDFTDWLDAILMRLGLPGVLAHSLGTLAEVGSNYPGLVAMLVSGRHRLDAKVRAAQGAAPLARVAMPAR